MTLTFIICASILTFVIGWLFGRINGEQRGRDKQWMEDFFATIEKEKARRDKLGRFKRNNEHKTKQS